MILAVEKLKLDKDDVLNLTTVFKTAAESILLLAFLSGTRSAYNN